MQSVNSKALQLLRAPEVRFFLLVALASALIFFVVDGSTPSASQGLMRAMFGGLFGLLIVQLVHGLYVSRTMRDAERSFLGITEHQIRTPLSAIRWSLQELGNVSIGESERAELSRIADVAAKNISNIIDSFQEIARAEDGSAVVRQQQVELTEFLAHIVKTAEPVGKQYGVGIHFERPNTALEVLADPVKLEIVFSNLVNNAIKYNHRGGMVSLSLRRLSSGRDVEIIVSDTGMGIAAGSKNRLFTKYYRSENAKRLRPDGTGLGLYLAKKIIEQHGGSIVVDSTLGKGSEFRVTLPLREEPVLRAARNISTE